MEQNCTEGSKLNRLIRDEVIENASSFDEAKAIITTRLNHLKVDLFDKSSSEENVIAEICRANEDKQISLMDLYAGYYSPCQVTNPANDVKGNGDMTDVMLCFSEGFTKFVESLESHFVDIIIRRRRATILLNRMLSIKQPMARLMYLYYYKNLRPDVIISMLYISRATFYRLKAAAIRDLTKMYYTEKTDNDGGDSTKSA